MIELKDCLVPTALILSVAMNLYLAWRQGKGTEKATRELASSIRELTHNLTGLVNYIMGEVQRQWRKSK